MNAHTARGAQGSRSPGAMIGREMMRRIFRALSGSRRAECLAGITFVLLLGLTAIGWWAAPGDHTAHAAPVADSTPYQFTAEAAPTGGLTTAAALILAILILGAALIGVLFFSPPPRALSGPRRRGDLLVGPAVDTCSPVGPSPELPMSSNQRPRIEGGAEREPTVAVTRPMRPGRSWRPAAGTPCCSWTSSGGRSADRWPGASPGRTARAAACAGPRPRRAT